MTDPPSHQDSYGSKNSIDVPNRRSTRGTINQAFIFDELEVVEDEFDEVFDENSIEAPVSTNSNDFEVTSFRQCVKHIYRTQGFLAFWNGNLANCLRYMKVAKLHNYYVIITQMMSMALVSLNNFAIRSDRNLQLTWQ